MLFAKAYFIAYCSERVKKVSDSQTKMVCCVYLIILISTHNIQFLDKIKTYPLILVSLDYRKNSVGTEKEFEFAMVKGVQATRASQ